MHTLWTDYRIGLSATPAPNDLQELWTQYNLLVPGQVLGKNITAFREKYCTAISYPGMAVKIYKTCPQKAKEIYQEIAPYTYRLQAEDYLDMPDIIYGEIPTELPAQVKPIYKSLEEDMWIELNNQTINAETQVAVSNKLRQLVQGGMYNDDKEWVQVHSQKLELLKEILLANPGRNVICPIQFKGELTELTAAFPQAKYIGGGVSNTVRQQIIQEWNEGKVPLLLCHPRALSHSVNLQQGGYTVIWYGLPWSLEQYVQLNGRIYRQGQQHAVCIHHLIMKDTVDEVVFKALTMKQNLLTALLNYLKHKEH